MRIRISQLRRLIAEEARRVIMEGDGDGVEFVSVDWENIGYADTPQYEVKLKFKFNGEEYETGPTHFTGAATEGMQRDHRRQMAENAAEECGVDPKKFEQFLVGSAGKALDKVYAEIEEDEEHNQAARDADGWLLLKGGCKCGSGWCILDSCILIRMGHW